MTTLKPGQIRDGKPVKLTVALPADMHRALCDHAAVPPGQQTGQDPEPARLVAPMLARFMSTDRGFAATRKVRSRASGRTPDVQAQPDLEQSQASWAAPSASRAVLHTKRTSARPARPHSLRFRSDRPQG